MLEAYFNKGCTEHEETSAPHPKVCCPGPRQSAIKLFDAHDCARCTVHTDHLSSLVADGRDAASAPTAADRRHPTPELARHLLVETLLRIGLDLHVALELSTQEPATRHLRSAVSHTDEALRRVRLAAIEHVDGAETAHRRAHEH